MLPPICVAACDSQRRRNDELRKTASAASDSVVSGGFGATTPASIGSPVPVIGPRPRPARPRGLAARDRRVQRRVTALARTRRSAVRASPAPAARAGHTSGSAIRCPRRAGPRARNRPRTGGSGEAAGRRRAAGSGRVGPARRTGYQSRGRPCPGTSSRSVAGTSTRSSGVTSTTTSGRVAASCAMMPPERVSEPVSLSGAPIARELERVVERDAVDRDGPRGADGHDPGDQPDRLDRHRLRPGVAQLIDEILHAARRRSGRGS